MLLNINPQFPVGNAAGWCKSIEEVQRLTQSAASFIVVGSITLKQRDGNPGNTFNDETFTGLNSLGLPNPGIEKLEEIGPEMVRIARAAGKPILVSIAASEPEEFGKLAECVERIGFDGIEVNLGCPNVVEDGERKKIISYQSDLARACLEAVLFRVLPGCFVSAKVSPMDPERLYEIASAIRDLPIDAVVTMNTVPNCLSFRADGKPLIDTPDKTGYAGGSGQQVFAQALGQVNQWRRALPTDIAVWGAGGIQSGDAVRQMHLAGASVMQVGTAYMVYGAKVFGDIAAQSINEEN